MRLAPLALASPAPKLSNLNEGFSMSRFCISRFSLSLSLPLSLFGSACAEPEVVVDASMTDAFILGADSTTQDGGVTLRPIAAYDFTAGDPTEERDGVRWGSHPESSARGLSMVYPGRTPDGDGGGPELRYSFPETSELYQYVQLRVPVNFVHRRELRLEVSDAATITTWRVGDEVVGVDGMSRGTISFIVDASVFLSNADNGLLNQVWIGMVRNETRAENAAVVGRMMDGTNNKLWAIWMDDYSARGAGPTVVWEFWPDAANLGGSVLAVHWSTGEHTGGNAHRMHTPFFRVPEDRGRLIDIITHVRAATSRGAQDGVVQLWRRGEGDARYTLIHDVHDADIAPGLPSETPVRAWAHGYLLGWANSGYAEDTAFHIARFEHWGATRPPALAL